MCGPLLSKHLTTRLVWQDQVLLYLPACLGYGFNTNMALLYSKSNIA